MRLLKIANLKTYQLRNQMNIYLIERDIHNYDEARGYVIVASSEEEARRVAALGEAYDGSDWLDGRDAVVTQIGMALPELSEAGVILADFVNG